MRRVNFTKMVASGNDFVVVENSHESLARKICNRKYGVGADGLLVLEKSKVADVRMRIFNADGSEAQMCGNGARCVALYASAKRKAQSAKLKIETKAGIIESSVNGENIKIKLTEPKNIKLNLPIKINNRTLHVNFINTGVPHTVIFTQGLEKIDVVNLGRQIRFHKKFAPKGTNADFVEVLNNNSIRVRTYERGVEDETLACGTGAVASALVVHGSCLAGRRAQFTVHSEINVQTQSGEILKVYFKKIGHKFSDVWLEGKAKIVYTGVYNV